MISKINKWIFDIIILICLVITGALLLYAKADYWSFVDMAAYPLSDSNTISNSAHHFYGVPLTILFDYIDQVKSALLDYSMGVFGYDLLKPTIIAYAFVCMLAIVNFFVKDRNPLSTSLIFIITVTLGAFFFVTTGISRVDVEKKFNTYTVLASRGDNYINEISERNYAKVDNDLESLQKQYVSGSISSADYQKEYDKFRVEPTPEQIIKINEWVTHSKYPALALSARGYMYENFGWLARGYDNINDATDDQITGMKKYFKLAVADHKRAIALNKNVLASYISLYRIASIDNIGYDRNDFYKKGISVFPDSYRFAFEVIEKMEPKWGGSVSEMRRFAKNERQYARLNPELISLGGYWLAVQCEENLYNENYTEAIYFCRRSSLYGTRWYVTSDLFKAYYYANDYKNALKTINEYLVYRKATPNPLLDRIAVYYQLKEMKKAVSDAKNVINQDADAFGYYKAGLIFDYTQDYRAAIDAYMLSLDKNPVYDRVLMHLFVVSQKAFFSSQVTNAASLVAPYFKKATELQPKKALYWGYYGSVMTKVDHRVAFQAYTKFLSLVSVADKNNQELIGFTNGARLFLKNYNRETNHNSVLYHYQHEHGIIK